MATPRKHRDVDGDRRRALTQVAYISRKAEAAERSRAAAMVFASDRGASLREIADASGLPHMTVKRMIDRARAAQASARSEATAASDSGASGTDART